MRELLNAGPLELSRALRLADQIAAAVQAPGSFTGTAAYASPEQAEGHETDARSDIFSFGTVFYEMVAGRPAFERDTRLETLIAVLHADIRSARIPRELRKLLDRCLRKDPERRIQTMTDVRNALKELGDENLLGAPFRRLRWLGAAIGLGVGLSVLWFTPPESAVLPDPTWHPLPLAWGSDAVISPDGSTMAFEYDDHIYVQRIDGGDPIRVTSDEGDAVAPTWSPSGTHLAFLRHHPEDNSLHQIYLVSALGGAETRVGPQIREGHGLDWSPDGHSLAAVHMEYGTDALGIFLVSLDGADSGMMRRLTRPADTTNGDASPAFSPDGGTIAFSRSNLGITGDVWRLRLDATEPEQLTFEGLGIRGVDWTPDGEDIVFSSERGEFEGLWRIPREGGEPRLVPGTQRARWPSVSSAANRLIYSESFIDTDLWRVEGPAFTGDRRSPHPFIATPKLEYHASYSPDGDRIAFTTDVSGKDDIWLADADGANRTQLVSMGDGKGARWSPDGRLVTFQSRAGGGRAKIYVVEASGGFPEPLPFNGTGSWSRDMEWFFGTIAGPDGPQIHKQRLATGELVQVTPGVGLRAAVGEDELVYFSKNPGVSPVWRIHPDGSAPVEVLEEDPYHNSWALWKDKLVYHRRNTFKVKDLRTGEVTVLVTLPDDVNVADGIAISPDGTWMLYAVRSDRQEFVRIDNFR